MTLTVTYADDLARVRLAVTGAPPAADYARIERSRNAITWTTVRGGDTVALTGGAGNLDDYEFTANTTNIYRATYVDGASTVGQDTASLVPAMSRIWLKFPGRPFLNTPLTVVDWSDITRRARAGIFPVVGRSYPVAVTELHGARELVLTVTTATLDQAADLDARTTAGDTLLLHTPGPACPVPTLYAVLGDTTVRRGASRRSERRYHDLALIEVAAPVSVIAGITVTWQAVTASFATWADLIAEEPTWSDVLDRIADPDDIMVP